MAVIREVFVERNKFGEFGEKFDIASLKIGLIKQFDDSGYNF